jgi:hypothetical protein
MLHKRATLDRKRFCSRLSYVNMEPFDCEQIGPSWDVLVYRVSPPAKASILAVPTTSCIIPVHDQKVPKNLTDLVPKDANRDISQLVGHKHMLSFTTDGPLHLGAIANVCSIVIVLGRVDHQVSLLSYRASTGYTAK